MDPTRFVVRASLYALTGVLVATAVVGAYARGLDEGARRAVAPVPEASLAPTSTPAATPSVVPPLTPVALGTADLGTILFADGGGTWQFDAASGQLQVRAFGPRPFSRGHAMSIDDGVGQAGFIDARTPIPALTPLSERAVPHVSDLSPDGTRLAYVINNKIRIYEGKYFNSSRTDVVPDRLFSSVRWSPSGRYLAAVGPSPALDPAWPKDVRPNRGDVPGTAYLVDVAAGSVRPLWVPDGTPRPPLPPARPPIEFVSWSPDERYVLLRHPSVASGENANGRDMFALEIATGQVTPLGIVVPVWSWIAWRAPHTLAYVEGERYEPWRNKRVRTWSPEAGFRDVSGPGEYATSPSWDKAGRLFFVRGTAGDSDAASDSSHLAVFDPSGGGTTQLLRDPSWAEHGTRISDDGTALLFVRRRTDRPQLEIWTAALDGSGAHPLWSYAPYWTANDPYTRSHAIYEAAGIFDALAWSR